MLIWACAAAVWPTSAAATEWPRRLFVLAVASGNVGEGYVDVAEGANGAVLLAARTGTENYVLRLRSDGGSETVARYAGPGGALGIGADAGGAVLVLEGRGNRLNRVSSSGASQVLAGTGRPGFSGDGGPAISADIDVGFVPLAGVVRTVTGAMIFTDSLNQRIRRIQPDGMIETIAGSGPVYGGLAFSCQPTGGDGGPAVAATLCAPNDVLAAADDRLIIADTGHNRIRQIAPDGTITTIAGVGAPWEHPGSQREPSPADEGRRATAVPLILPEGLAQLANGEILFTHWSTIARITRDGRYRTFLQFRPYLFGDKPAEQEMMDFAGRQELERPHGITSTREGGLLIAAGNAYYLAPRRTRHTLVAIRGARVNKRKVTVDLEASRAARATLTIQSGGRTIARVSQAVGTGQGQLQVTRRFASAPYDLRVTLRGASGARAHDALRLYLGQTLSKRFVEKELTKRFVDETPLRSCRRSDARHIDCTYGTDEYEEQVISFALRSTGVIWWSSDTGTGRPLVLTDRYFLGHAK